MILLAHYSPFLSVYTRELIEQQIEMYFCLASSLTDHLATLCIAEEVRVVPTHALLSHSLPLFLVCSFLLSVHSMLCASASVLTALCINCSLPWRIHLPQYLHPYLLPCSCPDNSKLLTA